MRRLFMLCVHSLKIVISNRKRLSLSISGITIGIVIFILGLVGIESATYSLYKQYINFDKNTIITSGEINKYISNNLSKNLGKYKGSVYSTPISASLFEGTEESNIKINASIYGVTPSVCDVPIIDINDGGNVYNTKIIEGRDLTQEDIKNKKKVLLISEFTSKLVFGNKKAIGKEMPISISKDGSIENELFTIVGVYKDTDSEIQQRQQVLEAYKVKEENMIIPISSLLIAPISTINEIDPATSENYSSIIYKFNKDNFKKNNSKIENFYEQVDSNISVYSYYKHMEDVKAVNVNIETMLTIIMIIIIIISGLNVMNTMFFSIKERIPEIGIKKSMGASQEDIIIQFVVESIVISIASVFLATFISITLALGLDYFYKYILNKEIIIVFKYRVIISAFLYAIAQAVIFSLIPAIKASKYNVVDALHHD